MKSLAFALLLVAGTTSAQDVLIRNATVHTAGVRGTLKDADVLVQGGIIRAVGPKLLIPAGVNVIDAKGKRLTPGLFGGLADIGLEEVSGEDSTVDSALTLPGAGAAQMRPEFDVTLAYNPASIQVPVARQDGLTFAALSANPGGSLVAGQGGIVRLDGRSLPVPGRRLLFTSIGSSADGLSGKSRAAQYMILDQAIREARGLTPYASPNVLLTPAGREALAKYLVGGRTVIRVERASDIRQTLAFSKSHGLRPILVGASEAWQVADELKAANTTVFVDALDNLPASFDQVGARIDNAALLHKAGVKVAFFRSSDAAPNARKIRQVAGNAVANGLPWEAGLAGLTRIPAQALGVGDQVGRIDVGLVGDLVLWDGDPLEVTSAPEQVWMAGKAMPMGSRQTELRDRYLQAPGALPRAYAH